MSAPRTRRQTFVAALPIGTALLLIAAVWVAGAVWSFEEQTRYARANGFEIPQLLPLVLDGMAVAMAAVSWAASLDARPAVFARLVTALAIAASSASNGAWAWTRSHGDPQTIVLAAVVPVLAMLAFEVLLAEVRRQVLRRRGQPGPVAITYPRLVRLALAPWPTFVAWRRLVLDATDPRKAFEVDQAEPVHAELEMADVEPEPTDPWQRSTPVQAEPVHPVPVQPARATPVRKPAQRTTRPRTNRTEPMETKPVPPRVLEMARALDLRYPGPIPGRRTVMPAMGWSSVGDAQAAINYLKAERAKTTRSVHLVPDPAEDDTDRVAV